MFCRVTGTHNLLRVSPSGTNLRNYTNDLAVTVNCIYVSKTRKHAGVHDGQCCNKILLGYNDNMRAKLQYWYEYFTLGHYVFECCT